MTTNFSGAELLRLVTAIPGVRGIEPGLGSTLKVIGSRMPQARFGVIIESGLRKATIEVSIDGSRPVKDIVRDIQETVIHSLSQSQQYDEEHTNSKTLDSTGSDNDNTPQVRVRVQSLL
ncbi:transcriptional regulator [Rothia sp. 27098_8_161]|uniref:transcriptional regulator n=1 Tax=Rothia sp. 27098_8_161 TaxID=3003678 RepID=UPI00352E5B4D